MAALRASISAAMAAHSALLSRHRTFSARAFEDGPFCLGFVREAPRAMRSATPAMVSPVSAAKSNKTPFRDIRNGRSNLGCPVSWGRRRDGVRIASPERCWHAVGPRSRDFTQPRPRSARLWRCARCWRVRRAWRNRALACGCRYRHGRPGQGIHRARRRSCGPRPSRQQTSRLRLVE